jgi:hypothetical protein
MLKALGRVRTDEALYEATPAFAAPQRVRFCKQGLVEALVLAAL